MNARIYENQEPPRSKMLHEISMKIMHRFTVGWWLWARGYKVGYIWDSPVGRVLSYREEDRRKECV